MSEPQVTRPPQSKETPQWAGNPFVESKAPQGTYAFIPVSTQWATHRVRLHDGREFVYVFGQGNPTELALNPDDLKSCSYQEAGGPDCMDNGAGYVTAELEAKLLSVLSSPDWIELVKRCEPVFRSLDRTPKASSGGDQIDMNTLIELGGYISLSDILTVNPGTGRKNLSEEGYKKLSALQEYLSLSRELEAQQSGSTPPCVEQFGSELVHNMSLLRTMPWARAPESL